MSVILICISYDDWGQYLSICLSHLKFQFWTFWSCNLLLGCHVFLLLILGTFSFFLLCFNFHWRLNRGNYYFLFPFIFMRSLYKKKKIIFKFRSGSKYFAAALFVWRAYQCSVVKVHRGVVTDELKSDLQVSHREVWERRSNSEIVAWRTETWY